MRNTPPMLSRKSICCQAAIWRFGARRRQCSACQRTWRIYPRQPGRHRQRSGGGTSQSTRYRRKQHLRQNQNQGDRQLRFPPGPLIVVIDGARFRFAGRPWTLYLAAVRGAGETTAQLLDPWLQEGRETTAGWRAALAAMLPTKVVDQLRACVGDGFAGMELIAREAGWVFQRCHFHVLAELYIRSGRHKRAITGARIRQELTQAIRLFLAHPVRWAVLQDQLLGLIRQPTCPQRLRWLGSSLIQRRALFHAYYEHPELGLPTTTGSLEAAVQRVRRATKTLRTPSSVLEHATAILRQKPRIACRPGIITIASTT